MNLQDGTVSIVKTTVALSDHKESAEEFVVEASNVMAKLADIRVVETLIRLSACLATELGALTGITPTEIITKAARKIGTSDV